MRRGHVPLRTCVVCGVKLDKKELIRIVRLPGGAVEVDTTGKKAGRGAYLCHSVSCWEKALVKHRLGHALRGPLSLTDRQALKEFAEHMAGVSLSS